MIVNDVTRYRLKCARIRRDLLAMGYEEVDETGGKLWELIRGHRMTHKITDVKIGPECKSVFIRTFETLFV